MFEYDRDLIKNPHLIPNTTQVPTFLIDVVMPIISNPTTKVMLFLVRKIYGWGKEKDLISLSQIQKGTNLSRISITRALQELEEKKVILKIKHKKGNKNLPNEFMFNERLPGIALTKFFREKPNN